METTSAAELIRSFVAREYIAPARKRGEKRVQISAGEVHRGLHLKNRVPNVCSVLGSKTFLEKNGLAIEAVSGPPSGMGTRVTYTYLLLEDHATRNQRESTVDFGKLRGLLKDTLRSLGGGEAFLRNERERFYQSSGAESK
jgi:hypothetical protein